MKKLVNLKLLAENMNRGTIRLSRKRVRHACCLCPERITYGQRYYRRGDKMAHEKCVREILNE
jgi:hypothetical protein